MLDRTAIWPPDYVAEIATRNTRLIGIQDRQDFREGAQAYYKHEPVEFISDWCFTHDPRNAGTGRLVRMPFVLFPRQRELVEFLHGAVTAGASGLVEKSRDMGATWVCVAYSVWLWLFRPGAAIGWGSRKADFVDRLGVMDSIFEKIRTTINDLPREFLPAGFDPQTHMSYMKVVNPENGATIIGESGDNIGRGGRTLVYFKDEAAHLERPELVEAALADNTNVQIDVSSVNGLGNVFHRRRESGIDWEPGTEMRRGLTYVFVLDWRDHPAKTDVWHAERRQKAQDEGLLHVFYQEVDRNYAASVDDVIIPANWVESAIDAHKKIKGLDAGGNMAALDVADGGGDRNALARRKGVTLLDLQEWGERDTGVTARRAVTALKDSLPILVQYDSIGVGAGVKAETNRLLDEKIMPRGIKFISWDAGAGPMLPDKRVVERDNQSPLNKDFYANLKAQGWWMLRRRFELTHRALTEKNLAFKPDDLISLPSNLPRLRQLQKELSQPTVTRSARLKLVVEKNPPGTRSPNLGDAVMMCFWPVTTSTYDSSMAWVG